MNTELAQDLLDVTSYKEYKTIFVKGTCNTDGEILCKIEPPFIPRRQNATYYISLISFNAPANIPNIDSTNNKFIYSIGIGAKKTIALRTGFYDIETATEKVCGYNEAIKQGTNSKGDNADNISIRLNGR